MHITQKYTVDNLHLRAFRDVGTSLAPFVFLLIHTAIWFLIEHFSFSPVSPLFYWIVFSIPCLVILFYQIRIYLIGRKNTTFCYDFYEDKALCVFKEESKLALPYLAISNIRENKEFLRIRSSRVTAILKKDELPHDKAEALITSMTESCPGVKRKWVRGRSLICSIITVVVITAVLLNCLGWLPPILDDFVIAKNAEDAALFHYARVHNVDIHGSYTMLGYRSEDGGTAITYVSNYKHDSCPTECYYLSASWNFWSIRDLTPSQLPVDFRTDTASVRVIQIEMTNILEVRCKRTTNCTVTAFLPIPSTSIPCNEGEYEVIRIWSFPDGIPSNTLLCIGDESFPISEMLSAG